MPESQSGVIRNIGGGMTHFGPGSQPITPAIHGYNGQGINGVGWGTDSRLKHYAWVGVLTISLGFSALKMDGHFIQQPYDPLPQTATSLQAAHSEMDQENPEISQ